MKSGFDYARQAAKAEQERLQARALELSQKLSKQSLDRRETQMYTEELYSVTERLTLTQHSLDTWVEQEAEAAASASDRVDDAPKQPQIRQSPMLQALVKRSEDDDNDAERKRLEAKPLGHRLLAAFRKHVRPTLEEQLEGLDSPFQPPSIISAPLERTLRDHMREVRKEWDASFSSGDDSRPSMSHEFGRALVELLRALAHEQRLHIPRGGIEALRERERLHSALGAGEAFQNSLWRSQASQGKRVALRLGGEEVEISVTYATTFDTLMKTAASYWRIDSNRYVVGDERGVQFIRGMGVLEGLRLCPPQTMLELIPICGAEREKKLQKAKEAALLASASAGVKINLDELAAAPAVPRGEDEDEDEDVKVTMKLFGYGSGRMSRLRMLRGLLLTIGLIIMLYLVIWVRIDLADEQPLCKSLTNAFASKQFTNEEGRIASFNQIGSATAFREWLFNVFPDVLFGWSTQVRERGGSASDRATVDETFPAVVAGHTILLGGMRLLQTRGQTEAKDVCNVAPFVTKTTPAPYLHSQFTSMVNQRNLVDEVEGGFAHYDVLNNLTDLSQRLGTYKTPPQTYGNATNCFYSADRVAEVQPFGPMRSNMTEDEIATERSNATGRPGSADLANAPCVPECANKSTLCAAFETGCPGALGAFVYADAEALGRPYSLITSRYLAGGYAITFPGDVSFRQYESVLSRVLDARWFDRQTRSVSIDLMLYNLQHHLVTNLQLEVDFDTTGAISSKSACAAVVIEEFDVWKMVPEVILAVWLIARALAIMSDLCIKKRPEPGEPPVRCLITIELVMHMLTAVLGLLGTFFRALYLVEQTNNRKHFTVDAPWPAPYLSRFGYTVDMLRFSVYFYAWALLVCTLRFALYYSILSKRLYILRLTISNATYRLFPTLALLCISLLAFAVGGNQLYFATTYEWRDFSSSVGTVLYLLRRPMGMNWERMQRTSMIWPLDSDEPSPVTIVFLLSFTCVTIWIMANLYRAVIIQEYANVVQMYNNAPPGDLTSDPWPSIQPRAIWKRFMNHRKEKAHLARVQYHRDLDWKNKIIEQKRKQRDLLESIKTQEVEDSASGKKGAAKVTSTRRAPPKAELKTPV